ncbi:hypothetical protein RAS1_23900 [Phycisphaerae bacterium RAS1]|nr:hypothetical protein RAS1_23900 [Phycisphaerae bacterium RAS1]
MLALFSTFVMLLVAPADELVDAGTGPQPAPIPVSWELEFTFEEPRRIEMEIAGQREVYWYLVYTATNAGERSQRFFPIAQLVTEDLRVVDTDSGIHPFVFDAIRERHRLTHKYLVSPRDAIGDLRVGSSHARESVFVWRHADVNINQLTIYVAGLSGETLVVRNPLFQMGQPDSAANSRNFTLRKTLEIRYTLPGSNAGRLEADPQRLRTRWVMR